MSILYASGTAALCKDPCAECVFGWASAAPGCVSRRSGSNTAKLIKRRKMEFIAVTVNRRSKFEASSHLNNQTHPRPMLSGLNRMAVTVEKSSTAKDRSKSSRLNIGQHCPIPGDKTPAEEFSGGQIVDRSGK